MKILNIISLIVLILVSELLFAQKERKYIREGNDLFEDESFENSEVEYRKALEITPNSFDASFNLGDAFFRQEKYEEATKQFISIAELADNKDDKAKAYHNLGNSLLSEQKLEESIEAYKNALRNNPNDTATKYNLAWAQNKLKNQEQQQQQNQDQQDKDKQDQNQDKQQNQDQEKKEEKQQQQNKEQQEQEKKEQQAEQNKKQISKEDAQRILEALQQDEQAVQEKIKKEQAKVKKIKIEKDW